MTHKFWVHNLTILRLCVCFLYYQQNSCLSTTRLITRKYLCCQETIEHIFTKTSFVGSCAFIFMNKKVCVFVWLVRCGRWRGLRQGLLPQGVVSSVIRWFGKKKKKNHWQTL